MTVPEHEDAGLIANLPPEVLADLERQFDSLRSNESQVSLSDPTWRHIALFPTYINRISALSGHPPTPMRLWAVKNPPADTAFNHASFLLNTARDGMVGIYAQVIKARILTPSVVYLFTRQICDAALTARWLLEDPTPRGLIRRGFAAEWKDHQEQAEFVKNMFEANAVEPAQAGALREREANRARRLAELGRQHRLIASGAKNPDLMLPSGRALFKNVEGPAPHTDMRWLFNLLSGVLHGKTWATLMSTQHAVVQEYMEYAPDGMPHRSEIVLARTDPNLAAMLLPIQVSMLQVHSAIERFEAAEAANPD